MNYSKDDIISFTYRDRYVECIVLYNNYHNLIGKLKTDYIGKNEIWYIGENKSFQCNLMKCIKLL